MTDIIASIRKGKEPATEGYRECVQCTKTKHITEFAINRKGKMGRKCTCKECTSISTSNREIEKKAKIDPGFYKTCNICDRTFKCLRNYGNRDKWRTIDLEACPFCGSEDLDNYQYDLNGDAE